MKHYDAQFHVRGESEYIDDVPPPAGMLHAAVYGSPVAHGNIKGFDASKALAMEGVHAVITAKDIPGENQIGPIIQDEGLLAETTVHFIGHPVAVVVAETAEIARAATHEITMDIEALEVIVDPREAFKRGHFIDAPREFNIGDIGTAWADCDIIVEGECDIAGQEHLYLETQRARVVPGEGHKIQVYSSTQSPYAVQRMTAKVLGLPAHLIEVDVKRLGGGFGGKEDQATPWAVMAALAAHLLDKPVELVLHRLDDIKMTGKRHPYAADFKLGLKDDGTIVAFESKLYQNSGATADLSTAVLERSLFHGCNSYFIPNARIFAAPCRTNLHPHTAFRGFGGPQGMFVIEAAIAKAAETIGVPREEIQFKNLLREGDSFPYGQKTEGCHSRRCWEEAVDEFDYAGMRAAVDEFNANNSRDKKGLAIMPICFGIAFTKTFMNQASALIHCYPDGSVVLSTGGVEMGQGVNSKLINICAKEFGISDSRVRVETTNTTRIANMSPSAASATTDLNGNATILAVKQIWERLRDLAATKLGITDVGDITLENEVVYFRGEATEITWPELTQLAYFSRVGLSAHAFYATPNIWFDAAKESGRPFAYHVYGAAIVQANVDCLRGVYDIESVRIVHDLGRPINEVVDIGQVEGGLAQGLGWMTLEELAYGDDGRILSHALSTYKAPDVFYMPDDLQVRWVTDDSPTGPYGSKAVGEPPLMYGIGAFFAIRDAMRAFRDDDYEFSAPLTPEKVLLGIQGHTLSDYRKGEIAAE